MRISEDQRLRERDEAFRKEMEAAPPFSTLWHLRMEESSARAKSVKVAPGATILAQERCGSCYFMYATVLDVRGRRVLVHWQREGTEQWIPYLATYEGSRKHPLRDERIADRYLSALRAGRVIVNPR